MNPANATGTATTNGRLWGARAQAWADLHCGEMEAPPFADARFDLVTGFNAFQFAANPVAALTHARRVAKPNGHVVVMTWGTPEGMQAASLVAALRGLGSSGVAARAMGHSGEEAVNSAHTAALAPFRQHGGGYRIGASFRWLLAGV